MKKSCFAKEILIREIMMTDNKNVENETVEETTEEIKETVTEAEGECSCENTDSAECSEKSAKSEKKKLKKAEAEIAELKAALATKESELADANDKYLRLCAEYDNFRKRSAKEREGVYTDAYCDALTQLLPVLDNLDRAAQYCEAESESPMAKGVELTLKSFVEAMAKMGVLEIEALGKDFDPNIHNAVMHVEDESVGENQVVEVFMKGYAKGDKVLRHSMVKVAN